MTPFLWAFLVLLLAVALIILEVFIPSGGVLSFLSAVAVIAAIFVAFYNGGAAAGTGFLAFTAVVIPAVLYLAVRWWPSTPLGRLILINPPTSDEEFLPDKTEQKQLVGKYGRAVSKMLPAGAIKVDGRTYDAVSEGMSIEAGAAVRVVSAEGNHIVVQPADEESFQQGQAAAAQAGDDILSQPIDQVIPDPFDEPLA